LALVIHRRQSCRQREDDGDQIYTQAKKRTFTVVFEKMDGRAFAAPKRLRPRRRDKPGGF